MDEEVVFSIESVLCTTFYAFAVNLTLSYY